MTRTSKSLKVLALSAAAALALTACGGSSTASTSSSAASSGASSVTLLNAGKLTVCSDVPYPPFEYLENGKTVGYDMDVAAEVAKDLSVEVSVIDDSFESIQSGLALAKCDVSISSISITEERKNNMDFSDPYLDDDLALFAKDGSGITDLESAKGKRVGVQGATTGESYAKDNGLETMQFEDGGLQIEALKNGQVDAVLGNISVLNYGLKDTAEFKNVANFPTGEKLGISIKKGNTALLEAVNATLKRIEGDGTLEKYKEKYGLSTPAAASASSSS
ncbi:ABC transporter substrate-binding protein [Neomicrococcus aestuarii]|uniref:Amino acid ABC transporter substrate-binding protein n=1 Tax=Neomicrococcus aestuarii TaxID=556325 RepID=A0A1L2ZPR8_9MICC|nr:ABC transporter substrate-binding protein [Neomicrococcus aestuarii]APF41425.1 amino acid ABC transporter substrate-binding protein [Neomicrococcus aestuarii]MBB5513383.1 polar amino acid transport system substrate-binding protein [Neomicrococcus aestuarii]